MHFTFGDLVVVEGNLIGVVVKSWVTNNKYIRHEVYVRSLNEIKEYKESDMERYLVRHKELSEEEQGYQYNATHPFVDPSEFLSVFTDVPAWYMRKTAELNSLYLDNYILDEDGDLVKIIGVDIDMDINNQQMNRVTDELGNKHFVSDIKVIYKKEDVK